MMQVEDLYQNTTGGYFHTNNLRLTSWLKESHSKMVEYPNFTFD